MTEKEKGRGVQVDPKRRVDFLIFRALYYFDQPVLWHDHLVVYLFNINQETALFDSRTEIPTVVTLLAPSPTMPPRAFASSPLSVPPPPLGVHLQLATR